VLLSWLCDSRLALFPYTTLFRSSCGIGGGSSESDPGSGEITGSIRFQTWNLKGEYEEYFTALIDAFTEENPGTEVEWIDQPAEGYQDSLSADAAAGNLPDVVDMGPEAEIGRE